MYVLPLGTTRIKISELEDMAAKTVQNETQKILNFQVGELFGFYFVIHFYSYHLVIRKYCFYYFYFMELINIFPVI